MRPRTVLGVIAVLVMAAVCVRLGIWQIARLHEKQRLNAALRAAERAPSLTVVGEPPPLDVARGRPLEVRGTFDESRQFLLAGRAHAGAPGVAVVTPLRIAGGTTAILVDRGWLYSADAATARPQDHPEPGERMVRGLVEEFHRGVPPMRTLERDSVTLWSARMLDADSVRARLPYAIAGYLVRQMPGPGVPDMPRRELPRPYDEMIHVSYAVQWFLFASILLGGSAVLAWSRRRNRLHVVPDRVPAPENTR
jgi:surfeit locus 1 family protein